jgi:hypothetical protein
MKSVLGRKRKARVGFPPGILDARFFPTLSALPCSVDFPPEINFEALWLGFLRLAFR